MGCSLTNLGVFCDNLRCHLGVNRLKAGFPCGIESIEKVSIEF